MKVSRRVCLALMAMAIAGPGYSAELSEDQLIAAVQGGGLVLAMRHASSPQAAPSAGEADPDNPTRERQLDADGRRAAVEMGAAFKALRVPVGEVWSSPAFRARETVRLAGLPAPRLAPELGDGGRSMQAAGADQGAWLRSKTAEPPPPNTNRLIVTHFPNLSAAFGAAAQGLKDGEALIFRPAPDASPTLLGRIPIEAWARRVGR